MRPSHPFKSTLPFLIGAALATSVAGVAAAVLPSGAQATIERKTSQFVGAPGYAPVDVEELTGGSWYSNERFVNHNPNSIRNPDADLDAVTKAVLLLESREPALDAARYHIAYQLLALDADTPEINHAVVQVTRFNLTGIRHRDIVEHYGANAAPAGKQTTQPHVSWRFVSTPSQGQRADIVAASRRVLDEVQAAQASCLGVSCLALDATLGTQAPFVAWDEDITTAAAVHQARWPADASPGDAIATPARVAEELYFRATRHGKEPSMRSDFSRPQMTFLLSLNDGGQEHTVRGVLRQAEMGDDDIAQIWFSRNETPGHVEWLRHIVRWPHRQ